MLNTVLRSIFLHQILYIINDIFYNIIDSFVLPDTSVNILKCLFSFTVFIRTYLFIADVKLFLLIRAKLILQFLPAIPSV